MTFTEGVRLSSGLSFVLNIRLLGGWLKLLTYLGDYMKNKLFFFGFNFYFWKKNKNIYTNSIYENQFK